MFLLPRPGGYFEQGDWHDTLMMPTDTIDVKFQADRYTGDQVSRPREASAHRSREAHVPRTDGRQVIRCPARQLALISAASRPDLR